MDTNPVIIPAMTAMKIGPTYGRAEVKFVALRVCFDLSPVMEKIKVANAKESTKVQML